MAVVGATAAWAENVPLPPPAPFPKTGVMPRPPSATGSPRTAPAAPAEQAAPSQSGGLASFLPPIFGGSNSTNFDPAQRALVDKVSAYLSRVQVMSGNFAQIGPDGRQTKGQFYVQKPGKVRFDYDEPARIDIVADGFQVAVRDRKLATQDLYPLSQTPLRYLLADRIDLLRDTNVTGIYADDLFITVVVEERQILTGTSKLMMMFGAKDYALKQWVVTDPQGYDTTIAISNLDTKRQPDPGLFVIQHTNYPN
jgi:outer membrane lipoprotein-sorting protein